MMIKDYDYLGGFGLFPEDTEELATRLNIGKSIITFNADRLRGICSYLLLLHEKFRKNYLRYEDVALPEPTLNSKQMAIALEFFLQIDGQYLISIDILIFFIRIIFPVFLFSGCFLYENMFISRRCTLA